MEIKKPYRMGEGPAVPETVLRGLREIDPRADCIWIPGPSTRGTYYVVGLWYEPDRERARLAQLIVEREMKKVDDKQNIRVLTWARYVQRGFRPVFGIMGRVPDLRDVDEFRERDRLYRMQFEQELVKAEKKALREDEIAEADAQYKDHIHQFAVEEYPYILRERRHVPFDGYAERFGTRWIKQNGPSTRQTNPYARIFDKEKGT